jgi:hypothetical protein
MFWLIAAIASLGVGGVSLFATLNRMGGDVERNFREAKELPAASFDEGAYGKLSGVATSTANLPRVPGLDIPCLLYELVVYESTSDRNSGTGWRVAHREIVGVELDVTIGDSVVRVHGRDVYLISAPSHDANQDLRAIASGGSHTSRVRYVLPGASVQVVGTLTREVDTDPAAVRDYRSVATRFRLIGKRGQPIVLAAAG